MQILDDLVTQARAQIATAEELAVLDAVVAAVGHVQPRPVRTHRHALAAL